MKTTLHDIIEEIHLESQDIDSIFRNKKRYMMARYAISGLQELNLTFATNLATMNVEIPTSCKVYKPSDFMIFVRAYLIDCNGNTIEISRSNKIPDSIFHYLLNCDGTLLIDCDGSELYDDCLVCNDGIVDDGCICECCKGTGRCLSEESNFLIQSLEMYKDSWVKEKSKLDYIEFSPDLEGMKVIIEYISDNTHDADECQLVVDENVKHALSYYIKFKLLENGLETMNQAKYYNMRFKALRDKAMFKDNAMTKADILSLFLKK